MYGILRPTDENGAMRSSYRWRERLLGSLQGQLQLATYLVVFAGFTGASSVGLFLGQRYVFSNERQLARASVEECTHAIESLTDNPTALEKELLFHSGTKNQLWVEDKNGDLFYSDIHGAPSEKAFNKAMEANPQKKVGLQSFIEVNNSQHIVELVKEFPSGARLWMMSNTEADRKALSNYLAMMILIWGSCLSITLLTVSWVVRRIVKPLNQLNLATADLTAEKLSDTRLQLDQAPTEIADLQETFNSLVERLAQSWGQQKQFVSAVSHELRTPLTIVQGYLYRTMKRSKNLTELEIKGLQTASEETIRMRNLLDDLLDLSRSDSGRLSISNEDVCLGEKLEQVAMLARNTIPRTFQLKLPKDKRLIARADPARLQQVLLDLIENADKYSPEEAPIELVLREDTEGPAIDVIDHGIGIPPEEIETVFERFQRASNAPYKTGTGLGLSLVKLFVEGMGGRIELASRVGEGSRFTVHLKS